MRYLAVEREGESDLAMTWMKLNDRLSEKAWPRGTDPTLHLDARPEQANSERKWMEFLGDWGQSSCLMGTEFLSGRIREFWRWIVVMFTCVVNVVEATELHP